MGYRLNRKIGLYSACSFVAQVALALMNNKVSSLSTLWTWCLYALYMVSAAAGVYLKLTAYEYASQKLEYIYFLGLLAQLFVGVVAVLSYASTGTPTILLSLMFPIAMLIILHYGGLLSKVLSQKYLSLLRNFRNLRSP